MKKYFARFFTVVLVLLVSATSFAISPYGPEGKRFGAGLYLGEPTGITLKGYLTEQLAINGVAAWSFTTDSLMVIGDVVFDFFDIPVDSDAVNIPFYAGAGAVISIDGGRGAGRSDGTTAGVRIPVGVAFQWTRHPVEAFVEVGPGVRLAPNTEFDLTGGVGARYYF
ncbi:MAG: hypothetical protein Q8P84_02650 [Deltaproteobacteria bacterium]|nr:hypothetical protein [Deltaproteobacteria bacterium]MDZ4224471.1 hypothetical protein [bacterium]